MMSFISGMLVGLAILGTIVIVFGIMLVIVDLFVGNGENN